MFGRMGVGDDVLAGDCSDLDGWDREDLEALLASIADLPGDAPAALRDARVLRFAAQPVVHHVIGLRQNPPGSDLEHDSETVASIARGRRTVRTYASAGLIGAFVERNERMLDRIEALVGHWPAPRWEEAVRSAVQRLSDASRHGRERGRLLRAQGRLPDPAPAPSAAWLLQHPADHWFRFAAPAIVDTTIRDVIDEWIADFAPSYAGLAALDWGAEEGAAGHVVDVELSTEAAADLRQPVTVCVIAPHRGDHRVGAQRALRVVPPGDGPFNGTIVSVLAGERWRICGELLADGSLLPADGTRRLHA